MLDCIRTGWVSTAGKYVELFEKKLCEITGCPHVIAAVNGTSALHIALVLAGVKPGDEVLVPSLTFVATSNAVHYCGAVPHFVSSEEKRLGIHCAELKDYLSEISQRKGDTLVNRRTGRPIRALVGVHIYGTPFDIEAAQELCDHFGIELVEDAAESLGSRIGNQHTGTFATFSSLSFNGNKIITTGGGGAVFTLDAQAAKHARHLTTTAKIAHPYRFHHDELGYNYRLPNLNAALGLSQLERFDEILRKKQQLHAVYQATFKNFQGATLHETPVGTTSNYWLNVLMVDSNASQKLDTFFEKSQAARIFTRPAWDLMHQLPMNSKCPAMDMKSTETLSKRVLCLPSSPQLVDALNAKSRAAA